MKNKFQLYSEIMEIVKGKDMEEIKKILRAKYRVSEFKYMSIEQLQDFVDGLKNASKTVSNSRS